MALNKTLQFAVHFSRFSGELGIPGPDLGQMIASASAAVKAYERDDMPAYHRHADNMVALAKQHGCAVDWPGPWPSVQRIGNDRSNQLLPAYD